MQTVLFTPTFEKQAARNVLTTEEVAEIAAAVAKNPLGGDLMAGAGGARKMRHAGRGKGKSGGYRTVHYFGGSDIPIFLLAVYGKDEKANLSKAERNELAIVLPLLGEAYRRRG